MKTDRETEACAEPVIYAADDGAAQFHLGTDRGSVWLAKANVAALCQMIRQNFTQHSRAISADRKLASEATCKRDLQVRNEGGYERYDEFDGQRKKTEALRADAEALAELEAIREKLPKGGKDVA